MYSSVAGSGYGRTLALTFGAFSKRTENSTHQKPITITEVHKVALQQLEQQTCKDGDSQPLTSFWHSSTSTLCVVIAKEVVEVLLLFLLQPLLFLLSAWQPTIPL